MLEQLRFWPHFSAQMDWMVPDLVTVERRARGRMFASRLARFHIGTNHAKAFPRPWRTSKRRRRASESAPEVRSGGRYAFPLRTGELMRYETHGPELACSARPSLGSTKRWSHVPFVRGQSDGDEPQETKPWSSCKKQPSLPPQMGHGRLAEAPRHAASAETSSLRTPN